jgi:hypothetical protein
LELREEERRITLRHILRNSVVVMTGGAGSWLCPIVGFDISDVEAWCSAARV